MDPSLPDVIVVGKADEAREAVTLDDLIVGFRTRYVDNDWPGVSIDPTNFDDSHANHRVRLSPGLQNTDFGFTLFDADYRLYRGSGSRGFNVPPLTAKGESFKRSRWLPPRAGTRKILSL